MANTARLDGAGLDVLTKIVSSPRVDGAWLDVVSRVAASPRLDGVYLEVVTAENIPEPGGGFKVAGEPVYVGRDLGVRVFNL